MFSQDEIDAALRDAQQAVDRLQEDVNALDDGDDRPSAATLGNRARTTELPRNAAGTPASPRMARILSLRVPIVVRVAQRRMKLGDIMRIVPGSILDFDHPVDAELDLLVNNHCIGSGVAVKVNERYGLRVSHLGGVDQRIRSLGRKPEAPAYAGAS